MTKQAWRRALALGLGSGLALAAVFACGTSRPGAATDGTYNGPKLVGTPCTSEGETVACSVETGRLGDIVNCFHGMQVCQGGVWSACGGAGTATTSTLAVTAGDASRTASGCASNPCNPSCVGIDVDADTLRPDGGFTSFAILGSVVDFTSFPAAKKAAMAQPTCSSLTSPPNYQTCNYDYCCAPLTPTSPPDAGTCVKWIEDAGATCPVPVGVDFQTGVGCNDGTSIHIPVCNRGNANANSGLLLIAGYPANPNAVGSVSVCQNTGNSPVEGCTVDLSVKSIPAGKCIDIPVKNAAQGLITGMKCNSVSDFGNGNRTSMINPPSTNFSGLAGLGLGSGAYTQLTETNPCNNYSFVFTQAGTCSAYGVQPPPPASVEYEYVASCPAGQRVTWNQFAYDTTVPFDSQVTFKISTASLYPDGGRSAFTAPVTVADVKALSDGGVASDPAICAISGPVPACPKNLGTLLAPNASNEVLKIGITMIATTQIPTVKSWQVTYNCTANE